MSKHTDGPWQINGFDRIVHGEIITSDGGIIAAVHDFNRYDRDEERAANARLIAAAPDLLAALVEAEDLFAHKYCYADGRVVGADEGSAVGLSVGAAWLLDARAAIAKVRGDAEVVHE
jgi:hypothetical protein